MPSWQVLSLVLLGCASFGVALLHGTKLLASNCADPVTEHLLWATMSLPQMQPAYDCNSLYFGNRAQNVL